MFSSKDLISFVFANENDTYYGDDLLKRDLNQYLWERLHGNYEAVYFLSAEGNSFRVRTFGDQRCSEYTPGKKKLFSLLSGNTEQTELGGWMLRQLCAKPDATAAFVCPLDDFCFVLSDPRWYPVLESIAEEKKRTGIFVLTAPATAEKSARLLLTSPVFEKLHETTITDLRDGVPRELYSTLKRRKWDSCVFLNIFTWERIHGLLLHLVMEYPDRYENSEQLDVMTEYLHTYLRDPEFARRERLLSDTPSAGYLMYEELFAWLKNERNWKKFEHQVSRFAKNEQNRNRADLSPVEVAVLRDPNAYAGRCLKIQLPVWIEGDAGAAEQARESLRSIRNEVAAPKNKIENAQIVAIAGDILNRLDSVHYGDTESYNWILRTLRFCVSQVYAPNGQSMTAGILRVLQKSQEAITIFDQCYTLRQSLDAHKNAPAKGQLELATLQGLEKDLLQLEKVKKLYVDLVGSLELELKMPMPVDITSDILAELEQALKKAEQNLANGSGTSKETIPEISLPEPEPETEKEPEYIVTHDMMYNLTPPSY